jgi:3-(methylthio)propanoyl-CoA dehydrogenase
VPYLKLTGIIAGGWMMAQAAQVAQRQLAAGSSDDFYRAKLATARYFAAHVLPQAGGLKDAIVGGGAAVLALPDSLF